MCRGEILASSPITAKKLREVLCNLKKRGLAREAVLITVEGREALEHAKEVAYLRAPEHAQVQARAERLQAQEPTPPASYPLARTAASIQQVAQQAVRDRDFQ